jgi:cyclic beta-1,2-glucan synthetase
LELFDLLNPIHHASTPAEVARYRVEPYVIAADVYSDKPHIGRGGWTWYTGAASWFYRVGLEAILGFHRVGNTLRPEPCIPPEWREYEINYRHHSAIYQIHVENPHGVERGVQSITLDGQAVESGVIDLVDDGRRHKVRVILGKPA